MRVFWIWLCLVSIVVFAFLTGYWLRPPMHEAVLAQAGPAAASAAPQAGSDARICTPAEPRSTMRSGVRRSVEALAVSPTQAAVTLPVLIEGSSKPDYPASAIARHQEGAVRLKLHVGTDGRVTEAKILRSSGSDSLDWAAVTTALHKWRYRPGSRNGAPEAMWREVKITFTCSADGQDNCDQSGARGSRTAARLERVSAR
jgi:protein TonB